MVEKRRRTRINLALLELKELTLEYFHKDVSGSTENREYVVKPKFMNICLVKAPGFFINFIKYICLSTLRYFIHRHALEYVIDIDIRPKIYQINFLCI